MLREGGETRVRGREESRHAHWGNGVLGLWLTAVVLLPALMPIAVAQVDRVALTTSLPGGRVHLSAVWDGQHVFVMGGSSGSSYPTEILRFDYAGGDTFWRTGTHLPSGRIAAAAFWDGKNMFVLGGHDGERFLGDVLRYNPATNAIELLTATLPTARSGAAVAWDGRTAYLLGGRDSSGLLRDIVGFSPGFGTPGLLDARLPVALEHAAAFYAAPYVYVVGGFDGTRSLRDVIRFYPETGEVVRLEAQLQEGRHCLSSVWTGSAAYFFGGGFGNAAVREVLRFDPMSSRFYNATPLPSVRYCSAAAWVGDRAYIFGGGNERPLREVLVFVPGTGSQGVGGVGGWASDWPMFHGNAQHTGFAVSQAVQGPAWFFSTEDAVHSSPAIYGGSVIVGSNDGHVYALGTHTGSLLWKYRTGGAVFSSPVVSQGVVYVGSEDRRVYALDATSGALKWSVETGGEVTATPVVSGQRVFVASQDNCFYSLSASTGATNWKRCTGNRTSSSPIVERGVVYVGDEGRNLHALDAATGNLKWTRHLDWNSPPSDLFLSTNPDQACSGGRTFCFDKDTLIAPVGELVTVTFQNAAGTGRTHSVCLGAGREDLYLPEGNSCTPDSSSGTPDGQTSAAVFEASVPGTYAYWCNVPGHRALGMEGSLVVPGKSSISFPEGLRWIVSPAVADGRIFVGTMDGMLVALEEEGRELWRQDTRSPSFTPVVDGNRVHVGSWSGAISVFDVSSGRRLWDTNLNASVAATPAVANGRLYVGTMDVGGGAGKMHALEEREGRVRQLWSLDVGGALLSSPAVFAGSLFFGSESGVYAVNLANPFLAVDAVAGQGVAPAVPSQYHPSLHGFRFSNDDFVKQERTPQPDREVILDALRRYPNLAGMSNEFLQVWSWILYIQQLNLAREDGFCFGMTKSSLDYFVQGIRAVELEMDQARADIINNQVQQKLDVGLLIKQVLISKGWLVSNQAEFDAAVERISDTSPALISLYTEDGAIGHSVLGYKVDLAGERPAVLVYDPNNRTAQRINFSSDLRPELSSSRLPQYARFGLVNPPADVTWVQIRSAFASFVAFAVHSPVELSVVGQTGMNVEGLYFSDGENKLFVIPGSPEASYKAILTGTGSGTYVLESFSVVNGTPSYGSVEGSIHAGQAHTYDAAVAPSGELRVVASPASGEGTAMIVFGAVLAVAVGGAGGMLLIRRHGARRSRETAPSQYEGAVVQEPVLAEQEAARNPDESSEPQTNQPTLSANQDREQCRSCGSSMPRGAKFCGGCGVQVKRPGTCRNCGATMLGEDAFCSSCGAKI